MSVVLVRVVVSISVSVDRDEFSGSQVCRGRLLLRRRLIRGQRPGGATTCTTVCQVCRWIGQLGILLLLLLVVRTLAMVVVMMVLTMLAVRVRVRVRVVVVVVMVVGVVMVVVLNLPLLLGRACRRLFACWLLWVRCSRR